MSSETVQSIGASANVIASLVLVLTAPVIVIVSAMTYWFEIDNRERDAVFRYRDALVDYYSLATSWCVDNHYDSLLVTNDHLVCVDSNHVVSAPPATMPNPEIDLSWKDRAYMFDHVKSLVFGETRAP